MLRQSGILVKPANGRAMTLLTYIGYWVDSTQASFTRCPLAGSIGVCLSAIAIGKKNYVCQFKQFPIQLKFRYLYNGLLCAAAVTPSMPQQALSDWGYRSYSSNEGKLRQDHSESVPHADEIRVHWTTSIKQLQAQGCLGQGTLTNPNQLPSVALYKVEQDCYGTA